LHLVLPETLLGPFLENLESNNTDSSESF